MDKLTVEQLHIFNSFIQFIENEDNSIFILSGGAGVGKTFLTVKLIQSCLNYYNDNEIIILCPTHKALSVIKTKFEMSSVFQTNIKFQTIAKFFDKKLKYNLDGSKYFKNTKLKTVEDCIIFIDESSMINDDDVKELIKIASLGGVKLVFIGDSAQLEPIQTEGKSSLIFDDSYLKNNEVIFEKHELKHIIRSDEKELLNIYSDFRKFVINVDNEISFKKEWYTKNQINAVLFTSSNNEFLELIKDNFTNTCKTDCKIIAYRNETVNSYNKFVRNLLFKNNTNRFQVGEKLIFTEPYIDYNNNDEIRIVNVKIVERIHPRNNVKYKLYELYSNDEKILYALHEESIKEYNNYFNEQKQLQNTKNKWQTYYEDYKLFNPPITYSYAITVHKSQGSTIDICFVDMNDIYYTLRSVKPESLEKTLYTAITRASKKLYCYF